MLNILRVRDFRLLWVADVLNGFGSRLLIVAVPFYVYDLTGSPLATGGAFVAEALPALLIGPFAGVFVDRWERRRTMIAVYVFQAVCVPMIPLVRSADQIWPIYATLFVENAAGQLSRPAAAAILPAIAGRGDRLVAANSVATFSVGVVGLAASPLGGALYATSGIVHVVVADSVSYLAAAGVLCLVTTRSRPAITRSATVRHVTAELVAGLRHLGGSKALRGLVVVTGAFFVANGALNGLLTPFTDIRLHGDARQLGLLLSALGAGYLVGAPLCPRLVPRLRLRRLLSITLGGIGVCFLGLFNAESLPPALVCIGLAGVGGSVLAITLQATVQHHTPDHVLGRVSASFFAIQVTTDIAGTFAGAFLAETIGLLPTVNAAGVLVIIAATSAILLVPARAKAVRSTPVIL